MDIQSLLTLQEIDGRLRDLAIELKQLPKRRSDAKNRLNDAAAAVEKAQASLDALKHAAATFGEDARRNRDHASKVSQSQIELRSMKAFKASAIEIDKAQAAADEAAQKLNQTNDSITPEEMRLRDAEISYKQENQIVQEMLDGLAERKAAIESEQAKVEAEREAAVKAVDQDDLDYYNRLRKTRWPAIVTFNHAGSVCTGCNLRQPPSVEQQVRRNDNLVFCQSCGRILY